jgi:prepilin-type N-terminal cleavage/methylation domain-containing protein
MATWRNQNGFTIPELLVAVAMLGLLLAAVLLIHQGTLQAYVSNSTRTETQQNARFALDRMAREIRQASAVTTAATNSITFTAQDGVTVVTYALTGTNLTRNSQTVVGGVVALTFVYRSASDATGATAVNTRRVDIAIQTQSEDTPGSPTMTSLMTSVRLRNLL